MTRQQRKTIAKLESLDVHSFEFYHVAACYFHRRLRTGQNCGMFFVFLTVLSAGLVVILWGQWWLNIGNAIAMCFCGYLGYAVVWSSTQKIRMLKSGRSLLFERQQAILSEIVKFSFPADPVGIFVLKQIER